MATIPTILYYLSLFLMVELDARKFGMRDVADAVARRRVGDADAALLVPLRAR